MPDFGTIHWHHRLVLWTFWRLRREVVSDNNKSGNTLVTTVFSLLRRIMNIFNLTTTQSPSFKLLGTLNQEMLTGGLRVTL